MAESSYPYSGADLATELQWSRAARNWGLDGVIADDLSSDALKGTSSGMTFTLRPGEADVNGFHYINDAVKNIVVPGNVTASDRFDRVAIRSDQAGNVTSALLLPGGTSPPTLLADRTDKWDLSNTQIKIIPGATNLILTDERLLKGNSVDVGGSGYRRDPRAGLLRVEDAMSGNPKLWVGTGSAWKQMLPGEKFGKTSNPSANTFNTNDSWQDYASWPAVSIPGVQSGDQLEIRLFVTQKVTSGNMGSSFRVSGVGIGASDYSHEILNTNANGFSYSESLVLIYDAASSGTAVITPRGRSVGSPPGSPNQLVRGTLAARIVK